ncbi:MAG: LysR family transcriptional regulator [Myxococcota bacterium]
MELDSWDDLRFVLAVSKHGTLTGAAKALGVDQTTVTRRLRALEERLETKLFEQLRGGARLTPAGKAFAEAAAEVDERLHALGRTVVAKATELEGPIRLTLSSILAACWIDDLHAFARRHPRLELQLVVGDDFRNLSRREADVALRRTSSPPEHLVGRKLSPLADAIYGAPSLRDVPKSELPWMGWAPDLPESILEKARARCSPDRSFSMYVDSMLVLLEAARRGHTALMLGCVVGDAQHGLVRLSEPIASDQHLWALTHPDIQQSPRVRALMDFLAEFVTAHRDALMGG